MNSVQGLEREILIRTDPTIGAIESQVLMDLSLEEAWKHVEWLSQVRHRLGGSLEAEKAVDYVRKTVQSYGVPVDVFEFDAYVSFPKESSLKILSPEQKSIKCESYGFSLTTPEQGVQGELIDVRRGTADDAYNRIDMRGKIALEELTADFSTMERVMLAETNGAIGVVIISWGTREDAARRTINRGIARSVWGNPTLERMNGIPRKIPIISISRADGLHLKELCGRGKVDVWLKAGSTAEWAKCHQPIATLRGTREPEKTVLLGGHLDAWEAGVTDNALGVACMLEVTRVLAKHMSQFTRSLKVAWWNCHENLYGGSTWYLDKFWEDLDANLIVHYFCDCLGMKGTTHWTSSNSIELRKFEEQNTKDILGEALVSRPRNYLPFRSADNSFENMGAPFVCAYTDFPQDVIEEVGGLWYAGWWWQSAEDTVDKVDKDAFAKALKMYAVSMLRLCSCPILPLEYVSLADELINALQSLHRTAKDKFDLTSLAVKSEEFKTAAAKLEERSNDLISKYLAAESQEKEDCEETLRKFNECLVRVGRVLTSALYTVTGKYGQDPPLEMSHEGGQIVPLLHPISELASMDENSAEFKALKTDLIRQRNKVLDGLNAATSLIKAGLTETA